MSSRRSRLCAALVAASISMLGLTAVTLSPGMVSISVADERDDLVKKKKESEAQIDRLTSQLEGIDVNLQNLYLKLEETRAQIPAAEAALTTARDELATAQRKQEETAALLASAQGELTTIRKEITSSRAEEAKSRATLGQIARSYYRGDTIPTVVDLLMGSKTTEQFLDAYSLSQTLLRIQSRSLTELTQEQARNHNREARQNAVEEQITALKKQADDLVALKVSKEKEAESAKAALDQAIANFNAQNAQLDQQKAAFQASLAAAKQERDSTQARIAQIDEENRRKAEEEARRKAEEEARRRAAGSGGGSSSGGSGSSGNYFIIPPIPGPLYVTSPFGMRWYPFGGYWMHDGVDLRSPCGQPQRAPGTGVVTDVRPAAGNSTHGNQIFINLGWVDGASWVVVTNHLSGFNVRRGQHVNQGDIIGWTGATGMVTGCHVHFEVWKNGHVINPMTLPGF